MCQPSKLASEVQFPGEALRAASIMVMQLALTQRNGVRSPGGARGSDGNLADHASSNLAVCAFDSRLPYPMAIGGIWQTRRALNPEFPGSRPGWPASPPRTACGFAFVRRMARFDPGWRLSRPRSPTAGGTALRSPAVRVRVAPRTRCLSGRRSSAPCKGGSPVRPWGRGSRRAVGVQADPPRFARGDFQVRALGAQLMPA